jgi:hypothetical protein
VNATARPGDGADGLKENEASSAAAGDTETVLVSVSLFEPEEAVRLTAYVPAEA